MTTDESRSGQRSSGCAKEELQREPHQPPQRSVEETSEDQPDNGANEHVEGGFEVPRI